LPPLPVTIVNDEYIDDWGTKWIDEIWTDDFGGVCIDENGICHISVVGNRKPIKSKYLIYKQVSNSYNYLKSILDEISEQMQFTDYTVWQAWISECCNSLSICLENEGMIHSLIEHLKTNNLFKSNVLKIYVGKNVIVNDVIVNN